MLDAASAGIIGSILGGIVGATVSGTISYAIHKQSFSQVKEQRKQDILHKNQSLAQSTIFKLIKIYDNSYHSLCDVEEALVQMKTSAPETGIWKYLRPVVNIPEETEFRDSEMSLILKLKENQNLKDIMELERSHNSMIKILSLYREKRQELAGKMPAHKEFLTNNLSKTTFETQLSKEEYERIRPLMAELDGLVQNLFEISKITSEKSRTVAIRMTKTFNKELDMQLDLNFNVK